MSGSKMLHGALGPVRPPTERQNQKLSILYPSALAGIQTKPFHPKRV
jgi:hypothetical protein